MTETWTVITIAAFVLGLVMGVMLSVLGALIMSKESERTRRPAAAHEARITPDEFPETLQEYRAALQERAARQRHHYPDGEG